MRQEEMQQLNTLAEDIGWEAAAHQFIKDQYLLNSVCDRRRADFQYLWELPEQSVVLEVAAGWGSISAALARNFTRIVAIEPLLERARFIRIRARQEKLPIDVICADPLTLPLAPEQFDAIVFNGVPGSASKSQDPGTRESQLRFLRSVRDLLKPSGMICLKARNRFGLSMLSVGSRHSREQESQGYRTYSVPGYRELFREAGYDSVHVYQSWHGSDDASMLLPLDHAGALTHFLGCCRIADYGVSGWIKDRILRVAAHLGLWTQLAPDLVFVMVKN